MVQGIPEYKNSCNTCISRSANNTISQILEISKFFKYPAFWGSPWSPCIAPSPRHFYRKYRTTPWQKHCYIIIEAFSNTYFSFQRYSRLCIPDQRPSSNVIFTTIFKNLRLKPKEMWFGISQKKFSWKYDFVGTKAGKDDKRVDATKTEERLCF